VRCCTLKGIVWREIRELTEATEREEGKSQKSSSRLSSSSLILVSTCSRLAAFGFRIQHSAKLQHYSASPSSSLGSLHQRSGAQTRRRARDRALLLRGVNKAVRYQATGEFKVSESSNREPESFTDSSISSSRSSPPSLLPPFSAGPPAFLDLATLNPLRAQHHAD
jgi:hypothetical protein